MFEKLKKMRRKNFRDVVDITASQKFIIIQFLY